MRRLLRRLFRRPRRLALRLALASLVIAFPALLATLLTTASVVRAGAVDSTFTRLDGVAEVALANPPNDDSPAALSAWARRLSASAAGAAGSAATPTRPERRVTLIARDGTVLFDTHEDPAAMDNHADRPEVAAAFASGYGRSQRFSATRGEDLTYVAVRPVWTEAAVLRLAEPVVRIEEAIRSILMPVALATLLAALAGGGFSLWYSRRVADRVGRLVRFSERVAQGDFTPETAPLRMEGLDELLVSLNRTAAALQQSFSSLTTERNQGATILSSMVEGVAVLDRDLRIQYVNRAFREVLSLPGDSWQEYEGRHARRVLEEKQLLKMVKAAMRGKARERELSLKGREVLARGAPIRPQLLTPDREREHSGEAGRNGSPPPDAEPLADRAETKPAEPEGAVLVLMDVTQVHALERVRRDFVANLSHELKTPLTAIRGFAETLLEGSVEEEAERQRFLRIIREHAVRLARLTDDLLRLARIEAGKMEVETLPVRIAEVLGLVLDSARVKAGQRTLRLAGDPDGVVISTDPNLLTEILQNLVDNAVQYTAEDGAVEIRGRVLREEVRISVKDNGVGIPKAHQARIFERFYRVDPARSRAVGGTGLGLTIARHTAERLGGRIALKSTPGQGSVFTLSLPRDGQRLGA